MAISLSLKLSPPLFSKSEHFPGLSSVSLMVPFPSPHQLLSGACRLRLQPPLLTPDFRQLCQELLCSMCHLHTMNRHLYLQTHPLFKLQTRISKGQLDGTSFLSVPKPLPRNISTAEPATSPSAPFEIQLALCTPEWGARGYERQLSSDQFPKLL